MADTGAPWNIPYIEPTDLVRNYPAAAEDLADAIAAGLTAAGNPGIGSNVVQTVMTDTFTMGVSGFIDITGLAVTITPTSDTSRILLVGRLSASVNSGATGRSYFIRFMRDAVELDVPTSPGSRTAALLGTELSAANASSMWSYTVTYLDSPATTSAVTYKAQARSNSTAAGSGVAINRSITDTNNSGFPRGTSALIAIEVAA